MKRTAGNWLGVAVDCWLLGGEAALVVPLRLARLARGGAGAKAEARLMVAEKIKAHGALVRDFSAGGLGKGASGITAGAIRHYLLLVRANRKRLMGKS